MKLKRCLSGDEEETILTLCKRGGRAAWVTEEQGWNSESKCRKNEYSEKKKERSAEGRTKLIDSGGKLHLLTHQVQFWGTWTSLDCLFMLLHTLGDIITFQIEMLPLKSYDNLNTMLNKWLATFYVTPNNGAELFSSFLSHYLTWRPFGGAWFLDWTKWTNCIQNICCI